MLTPNESLNHIVALSAEAGEIQIQAMEVARSAMRVASNAQAMQAKLIEMLAMSARLIDGSASVNHVREALGATPLSQVNGTAVTSEPGHAGTDGVGKGSTASGEPTQRGSIAATSPEVEQVLAEATAGAVASNDDPVVALEIEKVSDILARKSTTRTTAIDFYHETDASLETIAHFVDTDTRTVETWLRNARTHGDARVTRGDEARGLHFDPEA